MAMEALRPSASSSFPSLRRRPLIPISFSPTTLFVNPISHIPSLPVLVPRNKPNFKAYTAVSPTALSSSTDKSFSPQQKVDSAATKDEKFDWYEHWYPVAPICDLDKTRPHGKTVIGIDLVVWFDRNENAWKVFDDSCPHRLAPLSEGRIDQWGRLQCVYHGWCFGGSGDCKFIPQAPRDGPPIHTSKRACVAVYPSCVQNGILWFWPNSDPQYSDILSKKKPHYIPELDDPSYTKTMTCRDIPYGYEVLIENLMDPAHIPYAHYGMMGRPKVPGSVKGDREGGMPIEISITKLDINGFTSKLPVGEHYFIPPCIYYGYFIPGASATGTKNESNPSVPAQKKVFLIFYCVPVSPGNSRLIYATPRNFAVWVDRVVPRWIFHMGENLILDSDLYLLHVEERKLMNVGSLNWHKSCYVPTKADAIVVSFRRWLNKYGGTQVDWKNKFNGLLPPTPPREQLLDRFWSHTVKCSSCNAAYKTLNAMELGLKVASICLMGLAAVAKHGAVWRYGMVSMGVICYVASKWVAQFVHKTFRYHDYDHAFRLRDPFCVQLICKDFFT